jgi:hypothetical protein
MKIKFYPIAIISAFLMTAGCGGGNGEDRIFVSGRWSGLAAVDQSDCPRLLFPATFSFEHTVTQNDTSVFLRTDSGQEFVGTTVNDEGFSVDAPGQQNVNFGPIVCTFEDRIEYDGIFEDEDRDADVNIRSIGTCTNGSTCEQNWRARAVR